MKTSFFKVELFADCRLIKLLSSLYLCTVVLQFFLLEVVCILVLSLVLVLTPLLIEWLSITSLFITVRIQIEYLELFDNIDG